MPNYRERWHVDCDLGGLLWNRRKVGNDYLVKQGKLEKILGGVEK